jgi:cell wall-associated NlpC family hydrolase
MMGALGAALLITSPLPAQTARVAASTSGLVPVRARISGDDIVRTARHYLGVPYVLGGTTPRSFDCSGLVQYVFAQHGIGMPRTARQQAAVGEAPFPGDLQPGDLLFFYGGQGAQHIAIYVGADTIIHASSSGGRVRMDLLSGPRGRKSWFNQRLIAVRRVLPAEGYHFLPLSGTPAVRPKSIGDIVNTLSVVPVVFQ